MDDIHVACSPAMRAYFEHLTRETERLRAIAGEARARGFDPETTVEIPLAKDLADRVEQLVGPPGVAERIRELTKEKLAAGKKVTDTREEVALAIAKEIAARQFTLDSVQDPSRPPEPADVIYQAVRTGLAMLTEGVLVAPLTGVIGCKLKRNDDGSSYAAIYFAGPIRAAGGTAEALSVLIADVVRRDLKIGAYQPTTAEVERAKEEIPMYKRARHLQYTPSPEEIELLVRNCPVCVDGEGTEDEEVAGHRDLPRIETNHLRGGMALVIAEGLCLKAPKVQRHTKRLKIPGWEFIDELVAMGRKAEATGPVTRVEPSDKYLTDLIAGRPVLGHPSRPGGLRLRYGRGRTTGLAATAVNPAADPHGALHRHRHPDQDRASGQGVGSHDLRPARRPHRPSPER